MRRSQFTDLVGYFVRWYMSGPLHLGHGGFPNDFVLLLDELRYSYGVGLSWITGFGPLTFSNAKPINETDFDDTEAFQFSLGRSF